MSRLSRFLPILFCLWAATASALAPGDYRYTLNHGGAERSYLVHVPPQAAAGQSLPAVLIFHGGGGSAEQHRRESGADAAADRDGYLAVHPNGSGRLRDRLLTWNAGDCCGYAQTEGIDDVGFVAALLDDLGRRTAVDPRRIYALGHSNGGMMAHRLGDQLPGRLAAIASVAGAHVPASAGRPVPVLHIHSVDDPRALYAGGLGPPFPFTNHWVQHPAVKDTLAAWARRNGCAGSPAGTERREAGGHTAIRLAWSGCRDGAELVHWRLTGAGHGWPGAAGQRERIVGPATRVIDANAEAWRFFANHSLPP